jgi:hypothetical protein
MSPGGGYGHELNENRKVSLDFPQICCGEGFEPIVRRLAVCVNEQNKKRKFRLTFLKCVVETGFVPMSGCGYEPRVNTKRKVRLTFYVLRVFRREGFAPMSAGWRLWDQRPNKKRKFRLTFLKNVCGEKVRTNVRAGGYESNEWTKKEECSLDFLKNVRRIGFETNVRRWRIEPNEPKKRGKFAWLSSKCCGEKDSNMSPAGGFEPKSQ